MFTPPMRIIARMRQHGNGEQGVDAIQQGVAEAVREAAGCAIRSWSRQAAR
jgi:hypothetical protein